ncbi:MAG: CoA pyrophosphatase, partial [bacterium]|nr:CoA pyrophosphatase [bacterium]
MARQKKNVGMTRILQAGSGGRAAQGSYAGGLEHDSTFDPPDFSPSISFLEAHFASERGRAPRPIRNYHREEPVSTAVRNQARPAAVLVPIVERDEALAVLFTRRHHAISHPGQVCYPGGRADPDDPHPEATALREASEEIDLDPEGVRILGRLGEYHTQSGYRITPIVGVVRPPLDLTPA